MDDDGFPTDSSHAQRALELKVYEKIGEDLLSSDFDSTELNRDNHVIFLEESLEYLPRGFTCLDASRPWLCYWTLHALALLGKRVPRDMGERVVQFLKKCEDPNGGYGGGPSQMPHLATSYAAVCALVTVGGEEALGSINRRSMLSFLLRMKDRATGGFHMHDNGEVDTRGCYTALAVAHLLGILTPELTDGVMEYLVKCQTYEGGFAGEPGVEAHGGYSFCALAAAMLLGQAQQLNLVTLLDWVVHRQLVVEGGFQGRTNKLVDGCYSFWQGGLLRLMQQLLSLVREQARARGGLNRNNPVQSGKNPADTGSSPPEAPAKTAGVGPSGQAARAQGSEGLGGEEGVLGGFRASSSDVWRQNRDGGKEQVQRGSEGLDGTEEAAGTADRLGDNEEGLDGGETSSREESKGEGEQGLRGGAEGANKFTMLRLFPCEDLKGGGGDLGKESWERGNGGDKPGGKSAEEEARQASTVLFNTRALQAYLLICCQDHRGGLKDKPGTGRDLYHTCYCLSGLATAQHAWTSCLGADPSPKVVVGPYSNLLKAPEPLVNVVLDRYEEAVEHFKNVNARI